MFDSCLAFLINPTGSAVTEKTHSINIIAINLEMENVLKFILVDPFFFRKSMIGRKIKELFPGHQPTPALSQLTVRSVAYNAGASLPLKGIEPQNPT